MIAPHSHPLEELRMAELERYVILDSEPAKAFDRLTRLATHMYAKGAPWRGKRR